MVVIPALFRLSAVSTVTGEGVPDAGAPDQAPVTTTPSTAAGCPGLRAVRVASAAVARLAAKPGAMGRQADRREEPGA